MYRKKSFYYIASKQSLVTAFRSWAACLCSLGYLLLLLLVVVVVVVVGVVVVLVVVVVFLMMIVVPE